MKFPTLENIFSPKRNNEAEQEKIKLLNDLYQVGPQKPLGYLPIDTLIDICKVNPEHFEQELQNKGLKTLKLNVEESRIAYHGALFAYDENALQKLLNEHQEILEKAGWPSDSEAFVRNLRIRVSNDDNAPLFNLIADAFGDKKNRT